MIDGGLDSFSSKGSFSCPAKFVISNGVCKCIDDNVLFNCGVSMQVGVVYLIFFEKPAPTAECSRLLLSGFWSDSFKGV